MNINFPLDALAVFDSDTKAERCAVLVGTKTDDGWSVEAVLEVPNRAKNKEDEFVIKKKDAEQAITGSEHVIIGCLHTHPSGNSTDPSVADVMNISDDALGAVYHPVSRTVTYYDATGYLGKVRA